VKLLQTNNPFLLRQSGWRSRSWCIARGSGEAGVCVATLGGEAGERASPLRVSDGWICIVAWIDMIDAWIDIVDSNQCFCLMDLVTLVSDGWICINFYGGVVMCNLFQYGRIWEP
jgi:hypothetical protein